MARDAGCILVGLGGITHQQITGQVSETLLAVYVALLGVPAGIGLLSLRASGTTGETGTTGPSSSSPSQPSEPARSSRPGSSAGAGGDAR